MLSVLFSSMALAIGMFAIYLLTRDRLSDSAILLVTTLASLCVLSVGPVTFSLGLGVFQTYVAIIPLAFFVLVPSFYLYHQALISPTHWQWQKHHRNHFFVVPFVSFLTLSILLLSDRDFQTLFFADEQLLSSHAEITGLMFFIAVLAWIVVSVWYLVKIAKNTFDYHRKIKQVYSSEKGKTLWWIQGVSLLMVVSWVYALVVLALGDNYAHYGISETGTLFLLFIITWCIAGFGLQQRPGFADVFEQNFNEVNNVPAAKYERSALEESDLKRIASKLKERVFHEKLYLEADLNLYKLSETTGVSTQNISQTLSQYLQTTFFDYVNQARIEAAKPLLKTSKMTVLDVSEYVGFNARSSFYKAFKKETGMTPTEYKKT